MATKKVNNVENVEITEKKAVNVLDLLLGSDCGKIQTPYKDLEISRLSEAFGAPFIVRCMALTPNEYEDVQDAAINIQGKDVDLDMNLLQNLTVIESVRFVNVDEAGNTSTGGLLLKSTDLMSKFKAPTPKELCRALFLSGEVSNMYNIISALSGFSDQAVKEVKN